MLQKVGCHTETEKGKMKLTAKLGEVVFKWTACRALTKMLGFSLGWNCLVTGESINRMSLFLSLSEKETWL